MSTRDGFWFYMGIRGLGVDVRGLLRGEILITTRIKDWVDSLIPVKIGQPAFDAAALRFEFEVRAYEEFKSGCGRFGAEKLGT